MINCSDTSGPGFRTSSSKGEGGVFLAVINIAPNSLVIVLMSWALYKRKVRRLYSLHGVLDVNEVVYDYFYCQPISTTCV